MSSTDAGVIIMTKNKSYANYFRGTTNLFYVNTTIQMLCIRTIYHNKYIKLFLINYKK